MKTCRVRACSTVHERNTNTVEHVKDAQGRFSLGISSRKLHAFWFVTLCNQFAICILAARRRQIFHIPLKNWERNKGLFFTWPTSGATWRLSHSVSFHHRWNDADSHVKPMYSCHWWRHRCDNTALNMRNRVLPHDSLSSHQPWSSAVKIARIPLPMKCYTNRTTVIISCHTAEHLSSKALV